MPLQWHAQKQTSGPSESLGDSGSHSWVRKQSHPHACLCRFQFLPFGAGPRMCLGSSWAEMSVSLMAATMLQNLKFTAVSPTVQLIPVDYDITMNYNPTNGLHMQCEPRSA
jgi:cytochrome P450